MKAPLGLGLICACLSNAIAFGAPEDPEQVIRALVRANADKDLSAMARMIAQDSDVVGYTIGGRKFIGWADLARAMQVEFESVTRLEIPIVELKVWAQRLGQTGSITAAVASTSPASGMVDLSGEWEIREEDKSYLATLDAGGNGPYTHQGGRFQTTRFANGEWHGAWQQPGNDREGGFELRVSEDGMEATGIWWYTRVGERANIPPRQHGGAYHWKRVGPAAAPAKKP